MNRFVKYQSNEAGNFTDTRNLVTFNIPPGDYNFRESYIELDIAQDGETYTSPIQTGCLAIFQTTGRDGNIRCPRNEALVRRVRLSTQDQNLEDIDRVDVLRQTLGTYTTDPVERLGESYRSIAQPPQYGQISSPFRDVYNVGGSSKAIRAIDVQAQIPLKDLIELGKEREMPISQMGACKLEIYLQLDNLALNPTADDQLGAGDHHPTVSGVTQPHVAAHGDGITVDTLSIHDEYFESTDVFTKWGFYVGQAVSCDLVAGHGASAAVNPLNVIKSITRNGNNIDIVFQEPCFTSLNDTEAAAIEIGVTPVDGLPTAKVKSASLVLSQYTSPLAKVDELRYSTFTTELISTSQSNLNQQTLLEPNAFNVFLCGAAEPPFSDFAHLNGYRLSVNNVPILNRQAVVTTNLRNGEHWELIGRALKNGGLPWNNIMEADINMNSTSESPLGPQISNWVMPGVETGIKMIAAPVPITNSMKPFLMELQGDGTALGNLQLYKQVVRSVKL
tara:strand:- start:5120 stop:6631 length:1512 start_codon:yes stop_codon:yes gene_type:complete